MAKANEWLGDFGRSNGNRDSVILVPPLVIVNHSID
jgi:hypothetical protein